MRINSQNRLTLEQMIPGNCEYNKFLPKSMEQVYFCKDGKSLRYISEGIIKKIDLDSKKVIWEMAWSEVCEILGKEYPDVPKLNFFEADEDTFWYVHDCRILYINCAEKRIVKRIRIYNDWKNIYYSDVAKVFCFTQKNNLFYIDSIGNKFPIFISRKEFVSAGKVPSRNEFGINYGFLFSPDGSKIAFYVVDEQRVARHTVVRHDEHGETVETIEYPMAGGWSEEVQVYVYDFASASYVKLSKSDWPESYKTCLTWSPDGSKLYYAEIDRSQKDSRLKCFDVNDGSLQGILFEEHDDKYVEPENPLFFIKGIDNFFVWQSRRNGYNHLYLYNTDGEFLSQLTDGKFEVTKVDGYNENSGEVLFTSNSADATERNLYAVSLTTGDIRCLTPEKGFHSCYISSINSLFIDNFSSLTVPSVSYLRDVLSDREEIMLESADPYEGKVVPRVDIATYERSGEQMYCRIVRPADYSESKKYPLVMYVYGGPHVQLISNQWLGGTQGFEYMMADAGFIVASIDTHGSAARGKAFESSIYGNIGKVQTEDIKYAVNILTSKFSIDESRMGIYGWSFGGFLTARIMLREQGLFKVAVAGGPVTDWSLYEVMYTERYMGKPQENPDGYAENRLKDYIQNLDGKLLMIHCDNDRVVLLRNTLELQRAAIKNGKHVDLSIYPGFPHNVRGKDRVHLMETIKDYFLKNI